MNTAPDNDRLVSLTLTNGKTMLARWTDEQWVYRCGTPCVKSPNRVVSWEELIDYLLPRGKNQVLELQEAVTIMKKIK